MSTTRSDRGFRFPLQKYSDEKALYSNFRYLQEYLNYIRRGDKTSTQITIARHGTDAADHATYVTDGSNDEVQFQLALDALEGSGGEIVFFDGTYNFANDVTSPSASGATDNIRIIGKGAKWVISSGVILNLYARVGHLVGLDIQVAGNANATIKLSQVSSANEHGHWLVEDCFVHDTTVQNGVIIGDGLQSLAFIGNTFSDITGNLNHAFIIGLVGTGSGGHTQIVGNGFENCDMTGAGAGYLAHTPNVTTEGMFVGNSVEGSTVTSLTLAGAGLYAAHNVVDGVHQPGDHTGITHDHGDHTGLTDDDHPIYIKDAEFVAKGDVLVGTGPGTFDNLTVGADGLVLTADAAEATGVKWAAAAGGGGAAAFNEFLLIGA